MTIAWVVGAGGLLGRALVQELQSQGTRIHLPRERFVWTDENRLAHQFAASADEFAREAAAAGRWELYWAAGTSGMGSSEAVLAAETRVLTCFLEALCALPGLAQLPRAFLLASSAGSIYAGSTEAIITEATEPAPTTPYARGKLAQERLVRESFLARAGCPILLARLSTLYGPGQAHGKPQGLIAHIARSVLRHRAVQIYVPLDTVRDYIDAGDAARIMIASLRSLPPGSPPTIKIVASQCPTTVSEILGVFRRTCRQRLMYTTSRDAATPLYSGLSRFQSHVFPEHASLARTTIAVGIPRLLEAERAVLTLGPHHTTAGRTATS